MPKYTSWKTVGVFSKLIAKLIALKIKTTTQKSYLLVLPLKSNALVKKLVHARRALEDESVDIPPFRTH